MARKFTILLARREAQSYRAQGLHKEALSLYEDLLSTNENLDPSIKDVIQNEISDIETERIDFVSQREDALTPRDITRISQGWDERTSETYTLLCADALCSVGSYGDALAELKKLLGSGGQWSTYMETMANCLTGLYPPDQLPLGVERLLGECLPHPVQSSQAFELALAERLSRDPDKQQGAVALYRHLRAKGNLSPKLTATVNTAMAELGQTDDGASAASFSRYRGDDTGSSPRAGTHKGGLVLKRIRAAFKAITGRNGWPKGPKGDGDDKPQNYACAGPLRPVTR